MAKTKVTRTELSDILGDALSLVAGGRVRPPAIERRDGCDPNWTVAIDKDSEFRAAVERVMEEYELE